MSTRPLCLLVRTNEQDFPVGEAGDEQAGDPAREFVGLLLGRIDPDCLRVPFGLLQLGRIEDLHRGSPAGGVSESRVEAHVDAFLCPGPWPGSTA